MTWKELVKFVESQDIPDEMEIWFIDITYPDEKNKPRIIISKEGRLCIADTY